MATGFVWAHIDANGNIIRQIGNVSCKRIGDGQYQVQYNSNLFSDATAPQVTCYQVEYSPAPAIGYQAPNQWMVYINSPVRGNLNADFSFLVVGELRG